MKAMQQIKSLLPLWLLGKESASKVEINQDAVIKHIDELGLVIKKVMLTELIAKKDRDALAAFQVEYRNGQIGALVLLSSEAKAHVADKSDALLALARAQYLNTQLVVTYPTVIQSAFKAIGEQRDISHDTLVRRCQELFSRAAAQHASDIHITVQKTEAMVKDRVYGVMGFLDRFNFDDMLKMVSSLYNQHASSQSKDLTFNPENEQRTAIPMMLNGKPYQLRFESKPIHPDGGFVVVIRLACQDEASSTKPINDAGYSLSHIADIQAAKARDTGLIICSGETGSGKSTTVANLIREILKEHKGRISAFSVESPIENEIAGMCQIPVHQGMNEKPSDTAFKFSRTVAGLLRMDPNLVMVGEVSDHHTAKTLQHAVQSGHKVVSTIHAAGALKVFNRLIGLGLERDVISEPDFISLFVYQKLVPVLCDHCALDYKQMDDPKIEAEMLRAARRYGMESSVSSVKITNPEGCTHCRSGVKGQTLVAETLKPTPKLLGFLKRSDYEQAHAIWRELGGVRYQEHGLMKMFAGQVCPKSLTERIGLLDDPGDFPEIDEHYWPLVAEQLRGAKC